MTQSVWLIGASSLIKNSHSLICSHELRWHLSNLLVKHSEQYFQESVCPRNSIQVSHLHFYTTIKQNNKKPQCDYFMLHYWSQIHHWRWLFICVHSFIFFLGICWTGRSSLFCSGVRQQCGSDADLGLAPARLLSLRARLHRGCRSDHQSLMPHRSCWWLPLSLGVSVGVYSARWSCSWRSLKMHHVWKATQKSHNGMHKGMTSILQKWWLKYFT